MNDLLREENIEHIINSSVLPDQEDTGMFKIDSFAIADEGKTINGDDLYAIVQEAKEKGVTIASLMHKLPNARTQVIVTPGPGVVEQAPRGGKK